MMINVSIIEIDQSNWENNIHKVSCSAENKKDANNCLK